MNVRRNWFERLWEFIAQLDEEGNGKVSIQNVERAIQKIGEEDEDYEIGEYLRVIHQVFEKDEYGYEHFAEIFRSNEGSASSSFLDSSVHSTLDWSEYSRSQTGSSQISDVPSSSSPDDDYLVTVGDLENT